ncbi:MAG: PAS domain S-box protein [Burkholderiales bacterium]|nr:PAS domain S-box protein [Burkholderiales bacterium]
MPSYRRAEWIVPLRSFPALSPLRPARIALASGALFSALVLLLAGLLLWYERVDVLRDAQRDITNLSHTLAEHLSQTLDTIDLGLKAGLNQMQEHSAHSADRRHNSGALRAHANALASVTAIGLYGRDGELLAASTDEPARLPRTLVATDSLARHASGKAIGMHVSAPIRLGPNANWHIMLSRAIVGADGVFRGVIAAMFDLRTLADAYRSIDLGAHGSVVLLDWNATVLAAYPWREDLVAKPFSEVSTVTGSQWSNLGMTGIECTAFDGRPVVAAATPLRGYPLTLNLMVDKTTVLAPWRRQAAIEGTAAVLIGALALTLALLFDRHLRRREESVAQLRENQAELTEVHRIARLGSWRIEAGTGTIAWSAQAASLLGPPAALVSSPESLLERVLQEDRPRVERAWADLMAQGRLDVEFRTLRQPDEVRWLRARAEAPAPAEHSPYRARGTLSDVTDERRAEQAVQHLAAVVESTEDAIFSASADGRILSWNRGATRMFGYPAEETIGRRLSELLPPSEAAHAMRLITRAVSGESIEGHESELNFEGNRAIHIAVTLSPLRDASGRVTAACAVARDITSRREAERRRLVEHRVAQLLAESAPLGDTMPRILEALCQSLAFDCTAQWDFDAQASAFQRAYLWCRPDRDAYAISTGLGTRVACNDTGLLAQAWRTASPKWVGAAELEARHAPVAGVVFVTSLLIPVTLGSRVVSIIELLAARTQPYDPELLSSLRAIGGQIGQYIERKRVEAERAQANERLRSIAANIPGIVFEYHLRPDRTATFEFVSERALDMLEERPEALIRDPRGMFRLVDPGYRRQLLRSMRISRHSRSLWVAEMPIRTRSGRIRWVRGQSMPKHLDDGSVIWDGVIVDVTAQKQAEQAFQQMNEQLERHVTERTAQLQAANRELESFAYSVSHDLRAPLRSIDGFSRILVEEYSDGLQATARDYLQRVRNASERMGQLIDDLLSLSRVTRSELKRVRTDMSAIAEVIIQELRAEYPERSVDVSIHPGMQCLADPALIRIALQNLLGNAWKFTSKQSRASIEFGALTQRSKAVYYVRDDGAGFDMGHAGKLFGAFQRLHSPREFEGTGVGLATVSRIIDRHGGTVWAEATLGKGATFFFTLAGGGGRP